MSKHPTFAVQSVLRLKRFHVDELKRRLATLNEIKADLEKKLSDLDEAVAREKQRAKNSDIGRLAFPSFLQSIDVRRKNIRTTMKDLEAERARQQDGLAAGFQDVMSFEIAEEEHIRRAA